MYNGEVRIEGKQLRGFIKAKSYGCSRTSYEKTEEEEKNGRQWGKEAWKQRPFEFYHVNDCSSKSSTYSGGYSTTYTNVMVPKDKDTRPINYVGRIDDNNVVIKHGTGKKQHYRILHGTEHSSYSIRWGTGYSGKWSTEQERFGGKTPVCYMSKAYELIEKNDDGLWVFITNIDEHDKEMVEWKTKLDGSIFDKDQETLPYERDLSKIDDFNAKLKEFINSAEKVKFEGIYGGIDKYYFRNVEYKLKDNIKKCREAISRINHEKEIMGYYKHDKMTMTDAMRNFSKWNNRELRNKILGVPEGS